MKNLTEGILLINKSQGITSFDVVAKVRKILKTKQVGHTGTLDPLATGLLVILIGKYAKLSNYLTAQNKTYQAVVTFGRSTTTDDAEGEIVKTGDSNLINQENLIQTLKLFLGKQLQIPPHFSAISIKGERAYQKARRQEYFELPPREIFIHSIRLISWDSPRAVIEISCSKGTYIRSIARDLGEKLGVPSFLSGLHRTVCGSYKVENAITTEDLNNLDKVICNLKTNIEDILGIEKIELGEAAAKQLKQGKQPNFNLDKPPNTIFLTYCHDNLIALAKHENGKLISIRGF